MVEPGALCISREMPWKSTKIIYGNLRGFRLRTESTTRYNVEWAVLRDLQSERGELHLLYANMSVVEAILVSILARSFHATFWQTKCKNKAAPLFVFHIITGMLFIIITIIL